MKKSGGNRWNFRRICADTWFFVVKQIEISPASDFIRLILSSIVIGIIAGVPAILLISGIDVIKNFSFSIIAEMSAYIPVWMIVVVPLFGGLIIGLMIWLWPEMASQKGVVEVIKSNFLYSGIISLKTAIFHFIAPLIFLGMGGTLGPESPAAQTGAGMASLMGQAFHVDEKRRRAYIAAGMSAAIAAIFNAPLGAVFFSVEIILFNFFQTSTFSMLIISAFTADYVSRIFLGGNAFFILPPAVVSFSPELLLYLLLGITAGLIALLVLNLNDTLKNFFNNKLSRFNPLTKLLPVMLIFGIACIFYPQIFGIGYDAIHAIAMGGKSATTVIALLVLKVIFTALLLSAGGFGGLFAPSMFIGAAVGNLFAVVMNSCCGLSLDVTAFSIVGMAAVAASVNSIPMTALVIVLEITDNYHLIVPLILGIVMSEIIVRYSFKMSVHYLGLKQQGVRLFDGRELNVLKSLKVKQVMSPEFHKISADMSLKSFIRVITAASANIYWVIDSAGKVIGYVSFSDLKPMIMETDQVRSLVLVSEVMKRHVVSAKPDDDLDYVLKLFGRLNLEELPVVDPRTGKIIGTVYRNRVIQLYNQEIFKRETVGDLATQFQVLDQVRYADLDDDFSILEMPAPDNMIHQNLKNLNLRKQWGIQIVLIKRFDSDGKKHVETPGPDTTIFPEDLIVIVGQSNAVHEFQEKYLE
ncbi:MAG: chloride channel protein [Candidatus Marinimicrobia bacterium]|nr:chloride channel protein [Candidatus Neomarinimicrobiota bacterium]